MRPITDMTTLFILTFLLSLLAIPVGLVNPRLFQNITKRLLSSDANRKNVSIGLLTTAVVSFIGMGVTMPPQPVNPLTETVVEASGAEPLAKPIAEETPVINPIPTPSSPTPTVVAPTPEVKTQTETIIEPEEEESTPEPAPVVTPTPSPEPEPTYVCTSDYYNCSNFSTHNQAQAVYEYCMAQGHGDINGLDGNDNDGLACESLP